MPSRNFHHPEASSSKAESLEVPAESSPTVAPSATPRSEASSAPPQSVAPSATSRSEAALPAERDRSESAHAEGPATESRTSGPRQGVAHTGESPTSASARDAARAGSLAALEWDALLAALGDRLASSYGVSALEDLRPFTKPGAVRYALSLLDQMKAGLEDGMRLDFGEVRPIEALLDRAQREGHLDAGELDSVRVTQRATLRLNAEMRTRNPDEAPGLIELAESLNPLRELSDTLAGALTPAGTLNESAYPKLARLRTELGERREAIHRRLDGLLRNQNLSQVFQDRIYTLRGRRYVLPVKADFRGQLKGIVHDVSSSGATLFIEPQQVVEDTNALAMAEKMLELESERILGELSAQVGLAAPDLRANLRWLGRVDLLHAQARLSVDYGGLAPKVAQEGVLDLKGLGHPLMLLDEPAGNDAPPDDAFAPLDGVFAPPDDVFAPLGDAQDASDGAPEGWGGADHHPPVVRNRVRLGGDVRCLVISGANTGGKTVLLKSLGLAALLVRHGMHVPARPGSRCDLFDEVWADIGDRQSLENSLSTFSAQIRFMSSWLGGPKSGGTGSGESLPGESREGDLREGESVESQSVGCGPGSLVLLDEMLTGTEPGQGAALATAVLERLLERGATTVVTTHFGELKALAADHPGMVNGAMAFDLKRLQPTYRLEVGLPGASYAPDIARRYGLDDALVSAAERTLADRPEALDALLVATHQARRTLERREVDLNRRAEKLNRRSEGLEKERLGVLRREAGLQRRERGEVGKELRIARKRIASIIRDLQKANDLPRAGKISEALAGLEAEHAQSQRQAQAVERARNTAGGAGPAEPVIWAPAMTAWLPHLERTGEVEAVLDGGRRLRVRMGGLTLEVDAEDAHLSTSQSSVDDRSGKEQASRSRPARPGAGRENSFAGQENAASGKEILFALSTEENTLDLRGLHLDEALDRSESFLDQCLYKHVSPAMIIHGHGTGRLKAGLREHLAQSPYVAGFRPGEENEGRDGVTIIALKV